MTDRAIPRLLIVHHTPSPALHTMFEAVRDGARDPQLSGVEVIARPALGATPSDVLAADGLVLGSPANLGSMSAVLRRGWVAGGPASPGVTWRPILVAGLPLRGDVDTGASWSQRGGRRDRRRELERVVAGQSTSSCESATFSSIAVLAASRRMIRSNCPTCPRSARSRTSLAVSDRT